MSYLIKFEKLPWRDFMKKIIAVICIFSFLFMLSACKQEPAKPALQFIASDNNELGCVELTRDGIIYRPFGIIGEKSMRGEKIGIRGGDSSSSIFAVKDYSWDEWILESDEGLMPAGDMLFKAVGVTEIPVEFEKYKEYNY
ncbi:MAG TPA: hypothetical protein DEQ02_01630 [Ruminococcaceae bacterium]|nr:hypothetical protein [Oscillospiraceae bacterium]